MVPLPLLVSQSVSLGSAQAQVIVSFKENLRNRVGGCVVLVNSATALPTSVKDDQGNTYTQVVSANLASNNFSSIWYCQRIVGCPQKVYINFAAGQVTTAIAIFYDQPLLFVSSGTEALNTTTPTLGPVTGKSGEEAAVAVLHPSSNLQSTQPSSWTTIFQNASAAMVVANPGVTKVSWSVSPSVGGSGCIALFRAIPVIPFQWAFDAITKFTGFTPPPTVSASWSDTLTFTGTEVLVSTDASVADTLTWTGTELPTGDDEVPLTDTVTWSESYQVDVDATLADTVTWTAAEVLVSTDATLADTITWTGTELLVEDDEVPLTDTVTWSDEFDPVSSDASLADTLTWTPSHDATGYDWSLSDTVTWTPANAVTGFDWTLADTLTWSDAQVLASVSASLADTLTWADAAELAAVDVHQSDAVTWSGSFGLEVEADFSDTLTFTEFDRVIDDGDMPDDVFTLDDSFDGLPEIETLLPDLILFTDEFDTDNQLIESNNWADRFFFDGEVFPDVNAEWSDTLTWDMQPDMEWSYIDTIAWTDAFPLPEQNVLLADTLTWASVFGADPNLLGIARYRR